MRKLFGGVEVQSSQLFLVHFPSFLRQLDRMVSLFGVRFELAWSIKLDYSGSGFREQRTYCQPIVKKNIFFKMKASLIFMTVHYVFFCVTCQDFSNSFRFSKLFFWFFTVLKIKTFAAGPQDYPNTTPDYPIWPKNKQRWPQDPEWHKRIKMTKNDPMFTPGWPQMYLSSNFTRFIYGLLPPKILNGARQCWTQTCF